MRHDVEDRLEVFRLHGTDGRQETQVVRTMTTQERDHSVVEERVQGLHDRRTITTEGRESHHAAGAGDVVFGGAHLAVVDR